MLNHADRIKIGCMAQLVNVLGVFMTDDNGKVLKQTTYYPYSDACRHGRGVAVKADVVCDKFSAENKGRIISDVDIISSVATKYDDKMAIFVVNRSESDDVECEIQLGTNAYSSVSAKTLYHDDIKAVNTFDNPYNVTYTEQKVDMHDTSLSVPLKKHSFTLILLSEK